MEDTSFQPGNLQVPAGATVTFVNEDGAKHDARAQDGSWQTRALEEGESDSVTLAKPGLYEYRCSFHPGMKARLEVTPVTRTSSAG
jgi:plastocyanin